MFSFAATSRERFERSSNYRYVSGSGWLRLFMAVCLTFAPISIIASSHFLQAPERNWTNLGYMLMYMLGCGLIAGLWAFAFILNIRLLWLAIPIYLAFAIAAFRLNLFRRITHFSVEGAASALSIVAGYVFFISYIRGEGIRGIRLRTEMGLARRIHESLVPPISRSTSFIEIIGSSFASSEMGGDLLDIVEGPGRVGIYLADVSGHGVRAGVVMGMLKSAIRMRLLLPGDLQSLLNDLNRTVCQSVEFGMFATAAFFWLDSSRQLQYALAGHLPILHYRSAEGRLDELPNEHFPLGVCEDESYTVHAIQCERGDLLVLLTDGLTEAMDKAGNQFGSKRLYALIEANARLPLAELHARIMGEVGAHGARVDDQTLLLARVC